MPERPPSPAHADDSLDPQAVLQAVHSAVNGIVLADARLPDCPLVYANDAFYQMTGYAPADILGRNCRFLQGADTDPAIIRQLRDAVRAARPCQLQILNYRKDGTAFWNEVTVSPVLGPDGTVTHFLGIQTDTTARQEADMVRTRAEQDLRAIAMQLQAALQPALPASVPGLRLGQFYKPAWAHEGVGGDFSDVFTTPAGAVYLVVGDMSGKGLAAATQVATVRSMLRFALLNADTLADPITRVNDTLADHDLLSGFCTLFAARYNSVGGTLTYVNCGQDAGLILRADSGRVDALLPTGPILGALPHAAFTEAQTVLHPGDALALFTDGLTEAGPSRTALLGGDGVAALLAALTKITDPNILVQSLMSGVDAYAGQGVRDDQCLLVAIARP